MRKIVAALSTVVMLAAVTAVAQEKPKSGHEGMAKAGGAKSDASSSPRRRVPRRQTSATTPR